MHRNNKYLKEFLNLLSDDQVFYSYLTNTFMLNQVNTLIKELDEGIKSEEEVQIGVQELVMSLEILAPDFSGDSKVSLTKEEFLNLLKMVKYEAILNLAERRTN
jgi:hypothetical protein